MKEEYQDVFNACKLIKTEPNQVIELRTLGIPQKYGKPQTLNGFYDDHTKLARDAIKLDKQMSDENDWGIYITLNPVNPECLCWADNCLVVCKRGRAAKDQDILKRSWFFIDVDPVRRTDVSSTAEELKLAKSKAKQVNHFIKDQFEMDNAAVAMSGNGYHLLYRIDLPNDDESTQMIEGMLALVSTQFSDDKVQIDTTVSNAARIIKLYGTWARKGFSIPDIGRVHRQSGIVQTSEVDDEY